MGGTPPTTNGGGGGGGNGFSTLDADLKQLIALLQSLFDDGGSNINTDVVKITTHNVPQSLYTTAKKVRWALIQNLTSTDIMTLVAVSNGNGKAATMTNYNGTVLNPGPATNQAGGTYPTFNVDLSNISIMCDTTDGSLVSITYGY